MRFALLMFLPFAVHAGISEYELVVSNKLVEVAGRSVEKIAVNGTIPGPVLHLVEGDEVTITVKNELDEDTSVHWHGLLLPGEMDGVPGLNGFPGIAPGETFEYRFPVRQSGTYWYHAHSGSQEQDGHYGAIIIHPKSGEAVRADRDYVVLLSDLHYQDSSTILSNLKSDSDYYQNRRRTVGDFFAEVGKNGFAAAMENARMWGQMRMLPTDLADVSGYTFLVNGQNPEQNWTGLFKPGETVRLRFINAAAMSFFDVRIPGLVMTVVASDGQQVEPVEVDEFRFGVAETYDVIVTPKQDAAYTIVAEPIDRNGFALATIAPRAGMRGELPEQRPRAQLTMADMGHGEHTMADMGQGEHTMHKSQHHHGGSTAAVTPTGGDYNTGVPGSGWVQRGGPEDSRVLSYKDLRYFGEQDDVREPQREIEVRLGGSMERYTWTINDAKHSEAKPIELQYGERVRLNFINETMMAHPMHLHGMFVQLENGQPMHKLPNKHTVTIAPGDSYSALLTASEPGEWAFHCHLLYHMMSGMMNEVVVAKFEG
ncbi:MAG: copper resistance system multicopper oxidase [Candidatus Porifericomitaceae bacterium WSBS_2022_MAG_OTU9]